MFEPIIINLDYSPRDERQAKSAASRLGRSINRPNIGDRGRRLGSGRIDVPTAGVPGTKKPTGSRLDFDRDGWSDEGTTKPVFIGLPSGRDRPTITLNNQRERPTINLSSRSSDGRKNLRKKIKYGEKISDGETVSRKNGPQWLAGLSNQQISDLLVPNSYETYLDMLADGFGVDKSEAKKYLDTRFKITKPWLELDYSEGATDELKRVLKNTLDESPIFSWAVRKYGAPMYVVMTRDSAKSYNDRDSVKPLYDALKKMYPDAPSDPQFSASTHLDLDLVTLNPLNILDKKSWQTNEKVSDVFNVSRIPTDSDTVIDRSIPATFVHEWAHWYHSGILLSNLEGPESRRRSPRSLINPKDFNFDGKTKIASEYNSDNGNMNLHMEKVLFKDSPDEPRTITSYGHVSKKEAFAEGMLAYMHPNEQIKLKAINGKLKNDIEEILVDDKGVDSWKNSKANIRKEKNAISSGRQERRVTKLSSGAEPKKQEKPNYPRHPSFGPFLGKTEDIFADVKTWSEFKKIYDNLEINYFDYETTGLVTDGFGQSFGNGMPTQFGVTRTKGGKVIARLNIYTNPGEKLGEWSRNNLKNQDGAPLTDEWLSTQMSIAEAHQKLADFAGPNAIFGVQNSVFDNTVLEDALVASGIKWRPDGWIDTKVVADMVIPKWSKENQDAPYGIDKETGEKIPSSSLKALTEFLNISLGEKHHTADADAEATSELMSKIIDAAIDKKWNTDIFDKRWRDQHEKNKLEKYQKGIISFEENKNTYIAENSSNKSTTPKVLDKSKFGSGTTPSESIEYRMRHESPDETNGAPLHDLNNGAIFPEDIYGPNSANLYGGGFPKLAQKAVAVFRQFKGKPDSEITVYRAVPKGKKIQKGDWVSIIPEYAKIHGDSWLKDDFEIVTKKVKAKDLYNEGNSIFEWGYSPKLSSGKKDLSNNKPAYKGRVWKDRKNEIDGPVYSFRSQVVQYPPDGPPGISYFKGVFDESTWVDCLLYRNDDGKIIGILNHYPFSTKDPDNPQVGERKGNINIFIDPNHKREGIATKLVNEATARYDVDLRKQRYSEEGSQFINKYVRKLPENVGKQKLSSGSQPRMNLSDEEKREIIAIASQRTDDFSKSVVAQFRQNGRLSDKQWNALNRATLRRSRLSSGKKILPEERKEQRKLVNQSIKYLRNSDLQITEIDLQNKKTGKITKSPIFTVARRPIVLVDVNGVRVPFYQSTGRGGKKNVPIGEWYPIFGIGKITLKYDEYHQEVTHSGGWFNKGTEKEILDYYGVPELKQVAQFLNGISDLTASKIPFNVIDEPWPENEILELYRKNGIQPKDFYQITLNGRKRKYRNYWRDVKYKMPEQFYGIINRDLTPAPRVQDAEGRLSQRTAVARIQANRAKLGVDLVSITADKDESKESGRKKAREVELAIQDKNGDVIRVSIDSVKEQKFENIFHQDLTVRMKKNGVEVGVLHARTDNDGRLGNLGKLTISEILVPEDYRRRGHGQLMLELAERYNIDFEKVHHSSKRSELGDLFAARAPLSSGKTNRANRRADNPRLSSGAKINFAKKQLSVKLDDSDVEAIGNWNGYLYGDINAYLRNTDLGNSEIAKGMVDTFEKVSVPIPDDLVLFRGLRISPASLKSYEVGDVLQDDGFQSTTYAKRVAAQFNNPRSIDDDWTAAVFVVNVKNGTKVMNMGTLVDKLDLASDDEDEVLLRNGTKYKITNIEYNVNKNKWAGIDDTTFEGEKMTIITVDVVE